MKIAILGCGGTGINWASKLLHLTDMNTAIEGTPVDILLLDGSDSNLRDKPELVDVPQWLVPKAKGAGKDRALVAQPYKEYLQSRIHEIPEADVYIVMFSTGGGSGSVLGPEAMLWLLQNDKNVIGINTITTTSGRDAINSDNTIRGLAKYARKVGRPIVSVLQKGDGVPESDINERTKVIVEALVYALNDRLGALDETDLRAFLDYSKDLAPTLTELVVATDVADFRKDTGKFITTLSIIPDTTYDEPLVDEILNVRAVGGDTTLYFGTRIDRIGDLASYVADERTRRETITKSHKAHNPFESDDDDDMQY